MEDTVGILVVLEGIKVAVASGVLVVGRIASVGIVVGMVSVLEYRIVTLVATVSVGIVMVLVGAAAVKVTLSVSVTGTESNLCTIFTR